MKPSSVASAAQSTASPLCAAAAASRIRNRDDHPLRADADVLGEQPLQRPQARRRPLRELLGPGDGRGPARPPDQRAHLVDDRVGPGSRDERGRPRGRRPSPARPRRRGRGSRRAGRRRRTGRRPARPMSETLPTLRPRNGRKPPGWNAAPMCVPGAGQRPEERLAADAVHQQPAVLGRRRGPAAAARPAAGAARRSAIRRTSGSRRTAPGRPPPATRSTVIVCSASVGRRIASGVPRGSVMA